MGANLNVSTLAEISAGGRFPDFERPNHDNERVKLSSLTQPGLMEQYLGFTDGYPLILVF